MDEQDRLIMVRLQFQCDGTDCLKYGPGKNVRLHQHLIKEGVVLTLKIDGQDVDLKVERVRGKVGKGINRINQSVSTTLYVSEFARIRKGKGAHHSEDISETEHTAPQRSILELVGADPSWSVIKPFNKIETTSNNQIVAESA